MPELHVRLRWPDGVVDRVYSPSLVVTDHVAEGTSYPVGEFVAAMDTALTEAGERVRAKYGFPCSRSAASLRHVRQRAGGYARDDVVTVEAFER